MQTPVRVTFRDMEVSDAIEAACLREAAKLERYFDRITACQVTITESHRRHQQGNLFSVAIVVEVPGRELVVNREPPEHHADEDVQVALRESFDRMRRQLQDYARKLRGHVKTHEAPPSGVVARIFADEGYGFIETPEGREVYFHRNAVGGDGFDALRAGAEVTFIEEPGEEGPQATAVMVIRAEAAP